MHGINDGITNTDNTHPTLNAIIAGGLTGALELLISYPFEYIKTQLQLAESYESVKGLHSYRDVVKTTVEKRGVVGLYRGLTILMIFTVPRESVRFGVYENLKRFSLDENGYFPSSRRLLCGLGAGVSEAVLVTTMMETVKVKFVRDMLEEHQKYKGTFTEGIFKIVREQGIKGIYQGLTATVLKQGTNQAVRFYVVETMKFKYRGEEPAVKISLPIVGLFGVLGGWASVLVNNPIDVLKTRIQGYDCGDHRKNIIDCAKKIFMEEGILAFYKGTGARMIRVGLDAGFTFMCYDAIVEILDTIV